MELGGRVQQHDGYFFDYQYPSCNLGSMVNINVLSSKYASRLGDASASQRIAAGDPTAGHVSSAYLCRTALQCLETPRSGVCVLFDGSVVVGCATVPRSKPFCLVVFSLEFFPRRPET